MRNLAFLLLLLCSSCASYKRCVKKFGNTVTDTVTVNVPVLVAIPRDSVVIQTRTDTTYFVKESQQGRARVRLERTPTTTTASATCDSIIIERRVPVRVPVSTTTMGVNPRWRQLAYVLGFLLMLCLAYNLVNHFFTVSIKKK